MMFNRPINLFILLCVYSVVKCQKHENKYSKEANENGKEKLGYLKDFKNPLRMAKLNIVWEKAVKVSRKYLGQCAKNKKCKNVNF